MKKSSRRRLVPPVVHVFRPGFGILVDASCFKASYEPYFYGRVEWQGVDLSTGEKILKSIVYLRGTINLAEYAAIVEALHYLHQRGDTTTPVYSDSQNALSWVSKKRTSSKMPKDEHTECFLAMIDSLTEWLCEVKPPNPIAWWDKETMGKNVADYGRK